ncbi:ATP-binding cassette glutathione S-conjugate transporter ycf1 [Lodderomyces elongisporus]|nr:ATP-binding cassette glutathione S-conjugate transporter ycf1 [Lodderomyces elongisporus]WLF81435.1 ATP-binding cassette glutathione S-conjugate transporter ycf1 [Lodderomyces elongisporus]
MEHNNHLEFQPSLFDSHSWLLSQSQHLPIDKLTDGAESHNETTSDVNFLDGFSWLQCTTKHETWGPISHTYNDLTPCFTGLLFSIASLLMIVVGTYQVVHLKNKKITSGNRITWSFYFKLSLVLIQLAILVGLVFTFTGPAKGIIFTSLVLNVASTIVALAIHYIEEFKSTIPNGVLLFYWLFETIFFLGKDINLHLRSQFNSHYSTLLILGTVNAFAILLVESLLPMKPLDRISQLRQSPYDRANVFSRITFDWIGGLMKKGYHQFLTEHDLPPLPKSLKANKTTTDFNHFWNEQPASGKSLFWAVSNAFGLEFLLGGVFKGAQDCLAFVQPQLLRLLIKFVNDYTQSVKHGEPIPLTKGLLIAVGMFVVSIVQTACLHQYFQRAFDLGMKIRSSLSSAVYDKSLVLSNESKQESSTGDIVNLMSVDVQRLQDLVQNLQIIWSGPFQIIICLYSLHGLIGNSMWAGVAIMIIMIPLNAVIARTQRNLQKTQMKYKDKRSRLINEILNNIKSLKLYAWETPYLNRLNYVRNDLELSNLKKMGVFMAVSNFTWNLAPFLVSCSTFAVFVWTQKRSLSTDLVFPALSLFNLLSFPLAVVPMVITNIVEAQVAVGRLTKYLTSSELQSNAVSKLPPAKNIGDVAVSIKNGTFLWSKAQGEQNYKVALSSINLSSRKGQLDCIVGKVGSGKSSIIQAILGDLYKLDGEVALHGKVAYVSQVPWIMNGTVKDNILFGHKYDPEFYQNVLKACALTVDLAILPKGDRTEVGEKGISLSGGQKARLSLARAVYARADVYLLDDPLSAVDEHVGKHLTDHVLGPNGLLRTKCKILATNNIRVLSIADNLQMVSGGRIIEQGTYDDIMEQPNSKLKQLIDEFGKKKEDTPTRTPSRAATPTVGEAKREQAVAGTPINEGEVPKKDQYEVLDDDIDTQNLDSDCDFEGISLRRASEVSYIPEDERDPEQYLAEQRELADAEDADTKARKEHIEQGKVKWDVYLEYAKACGPINVMIFLGCAILSYLVNVASTFWLEHWSEINTKYGYNPNVGKYLGIYFLLGIGYSSSSLIQNITLWILCTIQGSKKIHNDMAVSVIRAPMSFFETTPIGRVLNRFSNDIYKIDEVLGRVFNMFFSNAIKVSLTIAVICFSTWQFVFLILPLGVLYVYYQQYYLRTSRELKRLDSVTRSPIFANFQESLVGVSTIRAYGKEERFRVVNRERVDQNLKAYHPAINSNRWLAVRLEFLGSIIILGSAGLSILTLSSGHLTAGMVGLSVSYALQVTQSLNWIVRMTVEVETNIVSVERSLEYSRLKSEAPAVIPGHVPPTNWPSEGEIKFNNYSTKYRPELELVLKNINIDIKPKEKIGIVGRTGAGKSSITLALFRIIEAFQGDINIDHIKTNSIGLFDLRHKLSIIPQDSQVFEGTIRSNLDPTEEYSDEQIWRALDLSHLKDHVLKMFEETREEIESDSALDVKVSEGGTNLSIGQRQLMCLGRVLLKLNHSNVLVLDEATAAVDVETDKILQQTIRTEFKDKTIITIAHRLNTILDSDRILVLEKGEVAEFDTPEVLLSDKNSLLYSLAKQGGFIEEEEG